MSKKQMILLYFETRKQYEAYGRFKTKWLENDKKVTNRMEKMLSDVGLNPQEIIKAIEHNDGLTYNNSAHQIVL